MALNLQNLNNGRADEKSHLRLLGTLLSQSGVVQAGAFLVAAQGSPDMTVRVAGCTTGHDIALINTDGALYHGWNTANANVTISANATGVTKKDAIVAYADLTPGTLTVNNPGSLKLVAIRGSGTDTAPDNSQIQASAVGTNPYLVLAHISVSNGASSINSGNITDRRTFTTVQVRPTTSFMSGPGTPDYTTTSTSFANLATLFTYTAGPTNERLYVDFQFGFYVSANSGHIQLSATGTGVTTQMAKAARTASTVIIPGSCHAVIDVTAGNTVTIRAQGKINTSGTITLVNFDATNTYSAKLVAYNNS